MTRPVKIAWANHSEKLHGPPYERDAATPQSLTEACKIHSQITHKVQTRAVGSAVERFVQAVRLTSCDLNMKTGGGQETLILIETSTITEERWEKVASASTVFKEGCVEKRGLLGTYTKSLRIYL